MAAATAVADGDSEPIPLVDDDPFIRELVGEAFAEAALPIPEAATRDEVSALLAAGRLALVLADTADWSAIAGGGQWAGLEQLRDAADPIPVVIFTAHSRRPFEGYAGRGFADLMSKPFDRDDLMARVDAHRIRASPVAPGDASRCDALGLGRRATGA